MNIGIMEPGPVSTLDMLEDAIKSVGISFSNLRDVLAPVLKLDNVDIKSMADRPPEDMRLRLFIKRLYEIHDDIQITQAQVDL